ncbi:MAG: hypothetical protein OXR62_00560 [Ahrensia sp.]|nr:hypothetical protein [Ahrensia sp.]
MAQLAQTRTSIPQKLAELFLWPGDAVCNLFNVEDPDSRMLLRMFVNLSVYGKVSVLIALAIF